MTDDIANQQIIQEALYGPANEMTYLEGGNYVGARISETRSYNSLKQLTSIYAYGAIETGYGYPSSNNNGKIASQNDAISGETVTYTYDALNRLASATNSGASPSWGQSFAYDGFGNLTQTDMTQGSAPMFTASYNSNNQVGNEDANGNPPSVPLPAYGTGATPTFDVENRLVQLFLGFTSPAINYAYDPANHRVWRYNPNNSRTTDEITFWSITGQKLGTYQLTYNAGNGGCCYGEGNYQAPQFTVAQTDINLYFGAELLKNKTGWVYPDRLGSIGKFYPYGIEGPSATANDTEKFTGYFRDAESGNDYAVNRYSSPGYGRFLTPDRMGGNLSDPGTWNKYAYTAGDPTNRVDRTGQAFESFEANPGTNGCEANDVLGCTDPGTCDPAATYDPCTASPDPTSCAEGQLLSDLLGNGQPSPACPGAGPAPVPAPPPALIPNEIVATYDCTRRNPLGGTVERDITYQVFGRNQAGQEQMIPTATIQENLTYVSGQHPPTSSQVGTFYDQISVVSGQSFKVIQTFTITVNGVTYNNLPIYGLPANPLAPPGSGPPTSNTIEAFPGGIFVNNND